MKVILLILARILFSLPFLLFGLAHLLNPGMVAFAQMKGVPLAFALVPISGLMILLGGVSILLGIKAKKGAWLIILFLIPVTYMMHNFWVDVDPQAKMVDFSQFIKNLGLIGGALFISYFGSGPLSFTKDKIK